MEQQSYLSLSQINKLKKNVLPQNTQHMSSAPKSFLEPRSLLTLGIPQPLLWQRTEPLDPLNRNLLPQPHHLATPLHVNTISL